jgi:hypothetical protein
MVARHNEQPVLLKTGSRQQVVKKLSRLFPVFFPAKCNIANSKLQIFKIINDFKFVICNL